MPYYKTKPVTIEAECVDLTKLFLLSPRFLAAVRRDRCNGAPINHFDNVPYPHVHTLNGPVQIFNGDYIICGTEGEFYPCRPAAFDRKYEAV